jgi:predicted dehydrogenase
MGATHTEAVRTARGAATAITASTAERADQAAQRLGIERSHANPAELIADPDIDIVHICTPNASHVAFATAAIEAGKHVICEKPLATTPAEAQKLAAMASDAGVITAVPFVYRFHPQVREARHRVKSGSVGVVTSIAGSYLQDWLLSRDDSNWRVDVADGGPSRAFADIGSHLADLVEFVTDDRLTRLHALTRTVHPIRGQRAVATEDVAAVLFEMASGALGTLLVSQVSPGRKNALTIELAGTKTSLRFEQENPDQLWIGRQLGSELFARDPNAMSPDAARMSTLPSGHPTGYRDAFAAFMRDVYSAIDGGTPEGLPTFAAGARAAEITSAVLLSASQGDWVEP